MVRDTFQKGLEALTAHVVEMEALARWMLTEGAASLSTLDKARAEAVLARKGDLARLDDEIEDEALHLVARQQPMARDLRAIAAALKLITYINRVGRYGKDIAQITTQWPSSSHVSRLAQIPMMAETVVKMLDLVMDAYKGQHDVDLARLSDWEETLDATRWTVFRECLTHMTEKPANIEPCSHYIMIARYLERCGDNICKMAEKTQYMVTGERVTIK